MEEDENVDRRDSRRAGSGASWSHDTGLPQPVGQPARRLGVKNIWNTVFMYGALYF